MIVMPMYPGVARDFSVFPSVSSRDPSVRASQVAHIVGNGWMSYASIGHLIWDAAVDYVRTLLPPRHLTGESPWWDCVTAAGLKVVSCPEMTLSLLRMAVLESAPVVFQRGFCRDAPSANLGSRPVPPLFQVRPGLCVLSPRSATDVQGEIVVAMKAIHRAFIDTEVILADLSVEAAKEGSAVSAVGPRYGILRGDTGDGSVTFGFEVFGESRS
jgi:hypothetical protein